MARRRLRKPSLLPKDSLVNVSVESNASQALRAFADAVREKALRSAAFAGAKVMYAEMRQRVPVDTGTLYGSLYQWHDDKRSTTDRQIYVVGPNKGEAPHWHLVEYGHWRVNQVIRVNGKLVATKERLPQPVWVPAKPYARPTFEAKATAAVEAMKKRLAERIADITAGRE
jgi:HK97 gp10 family phage protein